MYLQLEAETSSLRSIQGSWEPNAMIESDPFSFRLQPNTMECEPTLQMYASVVASVLLCFYSWVSMTRIVFWQVSPLCPSWSSDPREHWWGEHLHAGLGSLNCLHPADWEQLRINVFFVLQFDSLVWRKWMT